MSFKRVGDDPTALRVQKKQRVTELLLEDIPEDEATLIKNGKFACLVCKHCPVFDTVAVLSIHRQGKKHISNAKIRLEKMREDAELRQKREHMKYMETLTADCSKGEAPLLKITQQKKELALQGSTDLIKQDPVEERKSSNLPFFQSRKPIDISSRDTKRTESNKTLSYSEKSSPNTQSQSNSSKNDHPGKSMCKTPSSERSQKKAELSPSEQARREHFSRLRQAGWIMGLDGKWYKDENAEFDSDEDEPPPPP
ncbi:sodium channel modifier 1-like [Oculina patagonica]